MKVLWLCNIMPGAIRQTLSGMGSTGGTWTDHVLSGLREKGERVHILFPGKDVRGTLEETCSYAGFREGAPERYLPELESWFEKEIKDFDPDVIHVWGTEYGHTLAMVNAAEKAGLLSKTVLSIQGLIGYCARHYCEGIPYEIQKGYSFRDFIRQDNLLQQQKKFALRGELEASAIQKAKHIIGRTRWDEACTGQLNPQRVYHFCNETLRENFYEGQWSYAGCKKHRIFAAGHMFPLKGLHYLVEALGEIVKTYPDATLAVPGPSFLNLDKLRCTRYQQYLGELARKYGVEDRIEFLGKCSAQQMKRAYLDANVFVLPSTIENSPNSLGEAMLLGVPSVAGDVGGVADLMVHNAEGYLYQSTAPYMLASYVNRVFAVEEKAEILGAAAKAHAGRTHHPETNLKTLLEIYKSLS